MVKWLSAVQAVVICSFNLDRNYIRCCVLKTRILRILKSIRVAVVIKKKILKNEVVGQVCHRSRLRLLAAGSPPYAALLLATGALCASPGANKPPFKKKK